VFPDILNRVLKPRLADMPPDSAHHPLLRHRDGHHARVTFEELFFDLIYVFAVTQLSHQLLHHLTPGGVMQSLILWLAVWLGWQYTCWVTNWFDPETPRIRGLLFATMVLALCMAASIPEAFGERGLLFAGAYSAMQVGRTAFIVWQLPADHPLAPNYRRMLGWLVIAAVFWVAGGIAAQQETRAALWLIAVLCEYVSPMFGFALPGLGRSRTSDWTIEGGHLAERCQLFVIVALGETLLATGATLADTPAWTPPILSGLLATFLGTLAMWWLYFGTSSKDATAAITHSSDPGRIGAYFHYIHAILVAGIIATAVGNDLVLEHPDARLDTAQVIALVAGPAIYLLGSAIYKKVVYAAIPRSHIAGALVLVVLIPVGYAVSLLAMGWLTTAVLMAVGLWEGRQLKRRRTGPAAAPAHH
jgi:low temperature requirement protein LtrA